MKKISVQYNADKAVYDFFYLRGDKKYQACWLPTDQEYEKTARDLEKYINTILDHELEYRLNAQI